MGGKKKDKEKKQKKDKKHKKKDKRRKDKKMSKKERGKENKKAKAKEPKKNNESSHSSSSKSSFEAEANTGIAARKRQISRSASSSQCSEDGRAGRATGEGIARGMSTAVHAKKRATMALLGDSDISDNASSKSSRLPSPESEA